MATRPWGTGASFGEGSDIQLGSRLHGRGDRPLDVALDTVYAERGVEPSGAADDGVRADQPEDGQRTGAGPGRDNHSEDDRQGAGRGQPSCALDYVAKVE